MGVWASWGNLEERCGFERPEEGAGLRWRYVEHVDGNAGREDDAERRSARIVRIGGTGIAIGSVKASGSEWRGHLVVECEEVAQTVR